LLLLEHVRQVKTALAGIWQSHSPHVVSPDVQRLSKLVAELHDLGKGSQQFQQYIIDPGSFKGNPQEKAHTPLSTMLTLLLGQKNRWEPLDTLLLTICANAHHGTFRCLPAKSFTDVFASSKWLDDFSSGRTARILKQQLSSVERAALTSSSGIDFEQIELSPNCVRGAADYLRFDLMSSFRALSLEEKMAFRLRVQFVFSLLLEADKTFLAVSDPLNLLTLERREWLPQWIDEYLADVPGNDTNRLRMSARETVVKRTGSCKDQRICSLTAPTGLGKTLLAATWALTSRAKIGAECGAVPRIILVLPYLSIIDQTAKTYEKLLSKGGHTADGSWLLSCHSRSDRLYSDWLEAEDQPFFIDTWRSELVITTYDQFLMALLDSHARHQMRFHNLCDALIILDEVQSLPCRLWRLLEAALRELAGSWNSRILLMSATLPPFVAETLPLLNNFRDYFKSFRRYHLRIQAQQKATVSGLCRDLQGRLEEWLENGTRVLITLNTRRCAQLVYDYLESIWPEEFSGVPLLLLSADITPKDRLAKIGIIGQQKPCIVVSTQCIEAGVDIDMDHVIRDFAPWDSIVQVAGRCNREGKRHERAEVRVIHLVSENGRSYAEIIYDPVALQVTRQLISASEIIKEEEVLEISDAYFNQLDKLKDTGQLHLDRFANWQEDLPIRELLRGKDREQYAFIVAEQDAEILHEMAAAEKMEDRWQRKEAWRRLSGRIAQISVNLYGRRGFSPEEIATSTYGHWILRSGFYSSARGIDTGHDVVGSDGHTLVF
jgi:CRISPR-associated endonuclease/helicase Cas3